MIPTRSPLPLLLTLVALLVSPAAGQATPKQHDSTNWQECRRCRTAYRKAMEHTLARLPQAKYPTKLIFGWLLLADGRHPRELKQVIDQARRWRRAVGGKKAHNHRRNWYPALAGILLAEYCKHHPDRKLLEDLQTIVDHFVFVQEQTGGWFKWHEGAYKDRPDYPTKDLGILNAMVFGFLCSARTLGLKVPAPTLKRADACLHRILSDRGIAYGTGSRGGDRTGARGAFALLGLMYAREQKHRIARIYLNLLPRLIPNLDKGHHVGGLHCLGVVLGCHLLGPKAYRQLTDCWLDRLIDRQKPDGGIYVGDDGDAGGEKRLLGEDDASTAAVALMILLQDPSRLKPSSRPRINWLAMELDPPKTRKFAPAVAWAAKGDLGRIITLVSRSISSGSAPPAEKEEATDIRNLVQSHAHSRLTDARDRLRETDIMGALEILEPLARSLGRHPLGQAAAAELLRIRKDKGLQRELAAQKELAKAWLRAGKKGLQAATPAFKSVVDRFPNTRAAKKAAQVVH